MKKIKNKIVNRGDDNRSQIVTPPQAFSGEFAQPKLEDNLDYWQYFDRYSQWMFSKFEDFIGKDVLDIGAGIGRNIPFYIEGRDKVIATDVFSSQIEIMKQKFGSYKNFTAEHLDIMKDPLDKYSGQFDTVLCINVMEHLPDDLVAILRMKQCLRDGGRLIILSPAMSMLYCFMDKNVGHYRRYDRGQMCCLAKACGMKVLKNGYFNFFGMIPYYLKGKFGHDTGKSFSQGLNKKSGGLINVLSVILAPLEKIFPPPAGISEYIVMEK